MAFSEKLSTAARSMLKDGAIKNNISEDDFSEQIISWLADYLLKARYAIKTKFTAAEIAVTRNVFSNLNSSILVPPDIDELCEALPNRYRYLRSMYEELTDLEILYFIVSSPKRAEEKVQYISPAEFGYLMNPPRTKKTVLEYIHQGLIPGVKRNPLGTRWLVPLQEIETAERKVMELDRRRKKYKLGSVSFAK